MTSTYVRPLMLPWKGGPGLAERILMRVEFDTNGGCWLYDGCLDRAGYPSTRYKSKVTRMHRASYAAFKGEIGNKLVLHKCDVRCCVNPDHLFLGTHEDNMKDMVAKKRRKNDASPMSEAEKAQIRASILAARSIHGVAMDMGRDPSSIRYWVRKFGLAAQKAEG